MAKPDPFEVAAAQEGLTGLPLDIARSIYMQESSGGKNSKTSNAGAYGGMQILKGTFKDMADKGWDINDPVHNARAGIRYINQLHGKAGGDAGLTAVGYYGGPGAMAKAKNGEAVFDPRNPNAPDTIAYSNQVLDRMPNGSGLARVQRSPVSVGTPVAPPVDTLPIPTDIPAYHGTPDKWSGFGRALPQAPVQPQDINYGQPPPIVQLGNPGLMDKYLPTSNQPMMQAFKGWGGQG